MCVKVYQRPKQILIITGAIWLLGKGVVVESWLLRDIFTHIFTVFLCRQSECHCLLLPIWTERVVNLRGISKNSPLTDSLTTFWWSAGISSWPVKNHVTHFLMLLCKKFCEKMCLNSGSSYHSMIISGLHDTAADFGEPLASLQSWRHTICKAPVAHSSTESTNSLLSACFQNVHGAGNCALMTLWKLTMIFMAAPFTAVKRWCLLWRPSMLLCNMICCNSPPWALGQ